MRSSAGLRAHGQLDRRRRALQGTWREDMFEEAQNLDTHPYFRTKHESEAVVRHECERPWRVYRPGIVVGNSETGEMDKVDGPYYFFKLIRRIRNTVPQWMPMPGIEGREINIVPVDFVVRAMDHIAHLEGLDGRAFSLTDPKPADRRRGDRHLRPRRSRAASPRCGCRPARSRRSSRWCGWASRWRRSARRSPSGCSRTSGSRARCWSTSTTRPTSTRARPRRRSRGPGSGCRRWRRTRASSGITGSATSTRTCSATGPCSGRRAGGSG